MALLRAGGLARGIRLISHVNQRGIGTRDQRAIGARRRDGQAVLRIVVDLASVEDALVMSHRLDAEHADDLQKIAAALEALIQAWACGVTCDGADASSMLDGSNGIEENECSPRRSL